MRPVHLGLPAGLGLLAVLRPDALGWTVGVAGVLVLNGCLALGLHRHDAARLGPASAITLTRATLAVGVAALVPGFAGGRGLIALSVAALILDGADGLVARRTGTVTALGARFDMEVDAFLILALSVLVAHTYGPWVLLIGAARYLSWVAGRLVPWLRAPVPPRFWRKVVAATQGIVLTVAASGLLPSPVIGVALVIALVLLAESFGWDVVGLARRRPALLLVQRAGEFVPAHLGAAR